jgi:hypothetical protein
MNFERSKDPRKAIGIGSREYAIRITGMLAKKKGLLPEYGRFPNNPEIISSWSNSDGSYFCLSVNGQKYSVNYDFGGFEYGNMSMEDIKKILKIK